MNTHDPDNGTRYYFWKYSDTWEYTAAYGSRLKVSHGEVVPREDTPDDAIYRCWRNAFSRTIIVSSSNRLNEDIISQFPVAVIPWESPKLQSEYSILVEQRAITREAYEYWQQLKTNTENLGTLFDPLPSNVTGNIKCISHPEETVLGYFSISTVDTKRIFIREKEISWPAGVESVTGYEACALYTILLSQSLSGFIPIDPAYDHTKDPAEFIGYLAATAGCVDCRLAGGTNVKPDFWE